MSGCTSVKRELWEAVDKNYDTQWNKLQSNNPYKLQIAKSLNFFHLLEGNYVFFLILIGIVLASVNLFDRMTSSSRSWEVVCVIDKCIALLSEVTEIIFV